MRSSRMAGTMISGPVGATVRVNGRKFDYFGGTGYFGLQGDPRVMAAASSAVVKFGIHSASSRSSFGTTSLIKELEGTLAKYFKTEAAVVLPSGYLSTPALVKAVADRYDIILADDTSHYSISDALALTGKPVLTFEHLSSQDLAKKLKSARRGMKPLLVTDGVFSMSGRIAPIPDYIEIMKQHGGAIIVDDSHGVGVLGERGRGTLEHFGLGPLETGMCRLYLAGTLSKAFGGYGGFVAGSRELIDRIMRLGIFIGSTPLPNAEAAAALKGIEMLSKNPIMRGTLWDNVDRLKSALTKMNIGVDRTQVPIVAIPFETFKKAEKVRDALRAKNIIVSCFDNYVGATSGGTLRITLFSTHTHRQIDALIEALRTCLS